MTEALKGQGMSGRASGNRGGRVLVLAMMVATLSVGAGCKKASRRNAPAGDLSPQSAQLLPGPGGAQTYKNDVDGITVPVPANFTQIRRDEPAENNRVHLANADKSCQLMMMRVPGVADPQAYQQKLHDKLTQQGDTAGTPEHATLGQYDASHLHVTSKTGNTDDFYTTRQHGEETTLVTIHGPSCTLDFAATLQGFEIK